MRTTWMGRCLLLIALCAAASPALADVRLPTIFNNQMLLQRGVAAPVWGWAEPGEQVTVRFAGHEKKATADAHGKWSLKLDPLTASAEGRAFEVEGKNKIAFQNVLVGDVWICSGQSNMEWAVSNSLNPQEESAAAKYPGIRLFQVGGHITSPLPKNDLPGNWRICDPSNIGGFSAVGYFFGRELHREAGVPIGLINSSWGGTRIEPWVPPVGFRNVPELKDLSAQVDRFDATTESGKAVWEKYLQDINAWTTQARTTLAADGTLPGQPAMPGYQGSGDPTAIYNAMIYPIAPYAVRGAIWYQGESNGGEGVEYFHKMQALINGWRQVWNQGDFPLYFYFVQLANFQQPNTNPEGGDGWARLREAQRQALTIPHTGMAVITDIGEANDIHPRNKQDVGQRLARWALRDVYQKSDLVVSGPLYRAQEVQGNTIRLSFDHVGGGLMVGLKEGLAPTKEVADGKLAHFAIAGEDKKWHWADAKIDGDSVVVSSPNVPNPVAVRYAYTINPAGANLYNKAGLPASPFRTDAW